MKPGEILELEISAYAFEGKGIARVQSGEKTFVIFVEHAYPGDTVRAKIKRRKKNYAEASAVELISKAAQRTEARCKYFGVCGGCKQQDLNYETQVEHKQNQVADVFRKIGGFDSIPTCPIIPAENIFFYRNKMEFSFAQKRWLTEDEINSEKEFGDGLFLGLHAPQNYEKVLDIDECYLQSHLSASILNFTREFFQRKKLTAYSTKTHEGYLRNLVIRQSANCSELMVNLVTSGDNDELVSEYANILREKFPQITTVINNVSAKKSAVALGDYEKIFFGGGFIHDKIGERLFRISANSFFQTNTKQAEKLYQIALDFAEFKGDEIVYDLYSGAGTIAIYVSKKVKRVYGFEASKDSVNDFAINKQINNIPNVEVCEANLYNSFLPMITEKGIPAPEVVILDPPRSGMHKNTVDDVIKLSPKKIVYVSCNPATQARDCKLFFEAGYEPIKMQAVDMFPHTYHIECVVALKKLAVK